MAMVTDAGREVKGQVTVFVFVGCSNVISYSQMKWPVLGGWWIVMRALVNVVCG